MIYSHLGCLASCRGGFPSTALDSLLSCFVGFLYSVHIPHLLFWTCTRDLSYSAETHKALQVLIVFHSQVEAIVYKPYFGDHKVRTIEE